MTQDAENRLGEIAIDTVADLQAKYAALQQHADKLAEALKIVMNYKYHLRYGNHQEAIDNALTDYETFKQQK